MDLKYQRKKQLQLSLLTDGITSMDGILRINGSPVKVERKAKFLGIVFDSRLTWNDHVNYVVEKCKKRLNLLRAISGNSWGANKKTLLMIYPCSVFNAKCHYNLYFFNNNNNNIEV